MNKSSLRAWDAADEYLLSYLAEDNLLEKAHGGAVVVVNDNFGALGLSLHSFHPVLMTDSYLAMQAVSQNAEAAGLDELVQINTLEDPCQYFPAEAGHKAAVVLIRIPKSLAMLEDQLHRVRPLLTKDTVIIAAAMTRNIHNSTLALFEKIIGPTRTSLARKKARLVFSEYDENLQVADNPWPKSYRIDYEGTKPGLSDHAGIFSAGRLDIGTRFLLEHIPSNRDFHSIIDLACGNGVLGIAAAIKNPQARLVFTDESYMAVESAASNFENHFAGQQQRDAQFLQTDCLQGVEADSASLVLCNPPFHQQHAISDHIAWQMFSQARDVLQQGGELWVVGNRHLGYHAKLKRLFGNREMIAGNKKFVIIKVVK
ncbi:MAG TPA: methyltransferase domain-containing protein [Gammaproteobacteria bacterium]|nr:methyltransferase domain-containing protein [Gammaproteobacteria bacterium]